MPELNHVFRSPFPVAIRETTEDEQDILFAIQNQAGASVLTVDNGGNIVSAGDVDAVGPVFDVTSSRFGAIGDGVADDTAAIQGAIDAAQARGGGTVYVPPGVYLVSAPLVVAYTYSVRIVGDGMFHSEIRASHTSGPVLHVGYYGCEVSNLRIGATAARTAGAAGENVGILDMAIEPEVPAARQINHCFYDRIHVTGQPSHGIHFANSYKGATVTRTWVMDCGGHGIYGTNGSDISTFSVQMGGLKIEHCRIVRCVGNAICMGRIAATDFAYRIEVTNVDTFHCALTAGVRMSQNAFHFVADNVEVRECGIGGFSGDSPNRICVTGGVYVNGKVPRIINNRFIDVLGSAVTLASGADGAVIDGMQIAGDAPGFVNLNPAVVVEAGCVGVFVRAGDMTRITNAMTLGPSGTGNKSEEVGVSPQGFKSRNSEISIADDNAASIPFVAEAGGIVRGIMVLSANSSITRSAVVAFRVGDASAHVTILAAPANVAGATGVLTGTTGVDGNLTISADTATSTLYIENRRGSAGAWMPTFLSLATGELA